MTSAFLLPPLLLSPSFTAPFKTFCLHVLSTLLLVFSTTLLLSLHWSTCLPLCFDYLSCLTAHLLSLSSCFFFPPIDTTPAFYLSIFSCPTAFTVLLLLFFDPTDFLPFYGPPALNVPLRLSFSF